MKDVSYAEQSFVGGLMNMIETQPVSELFRYVTQIEPDDFLIPLCGLVFKQIKKSVLLDSGFDIGTIYDGMTADNPHEDFSFTSIGQMQKDTSGFAAISSHLKTIKGESVKRKAIAIIDNLRETMLRTDDPLQAAGLAESAIESVLSRMHGDTKDLQHITELADNWIERAEDEFAGKEVEQGFTSGFNGLDEMLGDSLIKPKSLVVIGANPGKGKTALMVTMSIAIAEQFPERDVHVYSLEMPSEQIADRAIGMAVKNKKPKHFVDADWGLVADHIGRLKKTNLYVSDESVMSIDKIKMNARLAVSQGKRIGAIFVDYMTLLQMPKAERRDLSVGQVSIQCKRLAKELDCIVVLLSQLSRTNMNRQNKRPQNSDLRDSGQIEQDCDLIIFPYYDYLFDEQSNCGPFAEVIAGKNRHGAAYTTYAKVINGVWSSCDQQEAKARLCQ